MGSVRRGQDSVARPHRAEYDYGDEMPFVSGAADSAETDLELDADERHREKRQRYERLKRKRPVGFAPWPEGLE